MIAEGILLMLDLNSSVTLEEEVVFEVFGSLGGDDFLREKKEEKTIFEIFLFA